MTQSPDRPMHKRSRCSCFELFADLGDFARNLALVRIPFEVSRKVAKVRKELKGTLTEGDETPSPGIRA